MARPVLMPPAAYRTEAASSNASRGERDLVKVVGEFARGVGMEAFLVENEAFEGRDLGAFEHVISWDGLHAPR